MSYPDLLAAAKLNPDTVDFKALRLAYVGSPEYTPYHREEEILAALQKALDEDNWPTAIEMIEHLLETCYLDIYVHIAAAFVYDKKGDQAKSMYHRKFGEGLLDSIFQSGDGKSYQTAFEVIDITEEYAVLGLLGFQPLEQSIKLHEGHQFDVIEINDPETGKKFEVYFNVDIPMEWLVRSRKRGN